MAPNIWKVGKISKAVLKMFSMQEQWQSAEEWQGGDGKLKRGLERLPGERQGHQLES